MNDIKFMHVRNITPIIVELADGQVAADVEVDSFGGATIAYQDDGHGRVNFAISRCHEDERFVKAQGRNRARGRLVQGKYACHQFTGTAKDFRNHLDTMTINQLDRFIRRHIA